MIPLAIGAVMGAALILSLHNIGALAERSGMAVLLGAIALFWPVFAVQANASALLIAVHCIFFMLFAALAAYGFRTSATLIAIGIMSHGAFDAIALFTGHPGPVWWPAFCGSLDVIAGGLLLYLIRTEKIPA